MTDPTEFDVDAALNRVVAAILPYRERINGGDPDVVGVTQQAGSAAIQALGVRPTDELINALLIAALLRLADYWLAPVEVSEP